MTPLKGSGPNPTASLHFTCAVHTCKKQPSRFMVLDFQSSHFLPLVQDFASPKNALRIAAAPIAPPRF